MKAALRAMRRAEEYSDPHTGIRLRLDDRCRELMP